MVKTAKAFKAAALGSVALLALGACSEATSSDPAYDVKGAQECADYTADTVIDSFKDELKPAWDGLQPGDEGNWDFAAADTSTYDPCAPASWIVIPTTTPGEGTPYEIALFHNGEFVDTALARPYVNEPQVSLGDENTVDVEYYWYVGEGENKTEIPVDAQFVWNAETSQFDHEGKMPPLDSAAGGVNPNAAE